MYRGCIGAMMSQVVSFPGPTHPERERVACKIFWKLQFFLQLTTYCRGKKWYCNFAVFSPLCEQLCLSAEGGVVVDNEMRSNLPDVYAAGDVCSANWDHSQLWFQVRSLYGVYKVLLVCYNYVHGEVDELLM